MTLEESLLNFMSTYGAPILVISVLIIFFIGVLKYFKTFDKIKSANVKKCIYYLLDIALSFGFVAIYYAIYKLSFATYVNYCVKTITAVTAMYAIYENFGLRKVLRMLGTWFINFVAKKQLETAKEQVEKKEEIAKTESKALIVSRETQQVRYGTAIENIGK